MRTLDVKMFVPIMFLAVLLVTGFSAITYANNVNDLCTDASGPLAVPSVTPGSTIGATSDEPPAFFCGTSVGAPGVWYTVVGTGNTMTATTYIGETQPGSADYDTKISVYCADCDELTCIDGNDDCPLPGLCNGTLQSTVTWCSQAGATYRTLMHGFAGDTGNFELSVFDDDTPCSADVVCEEDIEVDIDIKPWSDPNSINVRSKGIIAVAILTTDDFDATTVDPLSTAFGPNGAVEAHGQGHIEDVDGDGDLDLLLHFNNQETGLACGDIEAFLIGETFDGVPVEGFDSVNIVGCH